MIKFILVFCVFFSSTFVFADSVLDISQSDGYYSPIKRVIKHGYMTTYDNGNFEPNRPIHRKDLAVIVDKLHLRMTQKGLNLSKSDISELVHLSSSYKSSLSTLEKNVTKNYHAVIKSTNTQKDFQHELADVKQQLNEARSQQLFLWIGIGVSSLLGIFIK